MKFQKLQKYHMAYIEASAPLPSQFLNFQYLRAPL